MGAFSLSVWIRAVTAYSDRGMFQLRPWLASVPLEWHIFNEQYVKPEDRIWHGLP
jgi:hypothetical protein